jgi:hypothetical protein
MLLQHRQDRRLVVLAGLGEGLVHGLPVGGRARAPVAVVVECWIMKGSLGDSGPDHNETNLGDQGVCESATLLIGIP